jgi:hypothetical protein
MEVTGFLTRKVKVRQSLFASRTKGDIFGLTIAHLFHSVGDPVFVFLLQNPMLTPVEYAHSDIMINQMDSGSKSIDHDHRQLALVNRSKFSTL